MDLKLIPNHGNAHGSILWGFRDLNELWRHYDQPTGKWKCLAGGCKSLFHNWINCRRHMRKHLPGARKYECSEPGCQYKGDMGFYRRDKLITHRRNQHGLDTPRLHKPRAKRLT